MNKLKGSLLKFGYIEKLANGDSLIHRLNPLLKIILALMYIIFVISTSCLDFFELPLYSIIIGIMISLSKVSFMVLYVWYLMNCLFFDFGMDRKSCMQAGIYLPKSVRLTCTSIVFW